jgi:uncharacterized integral membrane protein
LIIKSKAGKAGELGIFGTIAVGIIIIVVGLLMRANNTASSADAYATVNSIAWLFILIGGLAIILAVIGGVLWLKKQVYD